MLHVVNGNLLLSKEVDVIVHQANCHSTMGKGIAKDIREMFPGAYQADCRYYPTSPESKLGKISYAICPHPRFGTNVVVANLYGQLDYWKVGQPRDRVWTNYDAVYRGFEMLFDEPVSILVEDMGITPRIGIPFMMGCGLANGDWNEITRIVNEVSEARGFDVYAYKL